MRPIRPSPLFGRDEPQLGLFDEPRDQSLQPTIEMQRELESIRARLPSGVRFGTSSWTFPGWAGLVYHRRYPNQRAFLRAAPRDFPLAVELRDRRLLTPEYARALREHDAVHVFNYWSRMPSLADQMRIEGLLGGSLLVVRLLLP